MRRPKPSLMDAPADGMCIKVLLYVHFILSVTVLVTRNKSVPSLYEPRGVQENSSYQTSQELSADDSITSLRRRLEVEERIVEGARRMAELPSSNRRERQKRKQSLQESVMEINVMKRRLLCLFSELKPDLCDSGSNFILSSSACYSLRLPCKIHSHLPVLTLDQSSSSVHH